MTTRETTSKIFQVRDYARMVRTFLDFSKTDAKVTPEQGVEFHDAFVEVCSSYSASNDKAEINLQKMKGLMETVQGARLQWEMGEPPVEIYGPPAELMQIEVVNNIRPDNPDNRKMRHAAVAIQQIVVFHNKIRNKESMGSIWQNIIQPAAWFYSSPPKERQPKKVETAIRGIQTSRHSKDKFGHCLTLADFLNIPVQEYLNLRVQEHLNHSQ